ncbi:MAG TPA: 50S ribosomal protein L32 [Dietzia sp.]|nr:50S ribosomal protein L32 [Dietzia sp.]
MAVPKRRLSRANTPSRRSQWKADNPALQETKIAGRAVGLPRPVNCDRTPCGLLNRISRAMPPCP